METKQLHSWLMLVYKIPREPTAPRMYVWRKLKRLGAVLLQDAIWVLPSNAWTREQFQWLTAEIVELGGEATLLESRLVLDGQDATLVQQFLAEVESVYREILTELEREHVDLAALSRLYQQAQAQDYFQSELGKQVRAALMNAKGASEA